MGARTRGGVTRYGLIFMIAFLYVNAILFVSIQKPDPYHQYIDRAVSMIWRLPIQSAWKSLLFLAFPAWALAQHSQEPYFTELVYYPLSAAIIWFGYGCLFGWGYQTRRMKKVILAVGGCWLLMVVVGWTVLG